MGIDIPKALEMRNRANKFPSLRKQNWTDQAARDFKYYENCTREQFDRLGKTHKQAS